MIKTIEATTFFKDKIRPSCLPSDAISPDWPGLVSRVASLEPLHYPLETLAPILRYENKHIGAGAKTLTAIDSIDKNTVFVVCGQQAGLFGGPLYTLYKALHTVRLSERLAKASGRNVLPLFWIASDDHDFDEVRSIGMRSSDGRPVRAEYTPSTYSEDMPVGGIILDENIVEVVEFFAHSLSHGDRSQRYGDIIRSSWRPGVSWADAFAAQLAGLCGSFGLILIDPRWDGIKALFRHITAAEIKNPHLSARLVNEEADKLERSQKQRKVLRKPEGATNLFYETGGQRYLLRTDGTRFSAGPIFFTESELLEKLEIHPGDFSPGAVLRPVCQDAIIPVAAFIGGPGERLYLEQIKPVYEAFGVNRSIVWPRASFTLIDNRVMRVLQKDNIALEKLFENPDILLKERAAGSIPEDLKERFDSLENSIGLDFSGISDGIGKLDKSLVNMVVKEKGRILHIIEGIKGRAVKAHRTLSYTSEKRIMSAVYFLRPGGGPQERWFGADAPYIMFGEDELVELMKCTSPGEENHKLVLIE